jgi:hypothetical protein
MNQKIRELAEQAGFQSIVRGDHIVFDISTKENLKEFAELIIRECIKAAGDPGDGLIKGDTWHDGVRASIWSIQQEFGLDRNFGIES